MAGASRDDKGWRVRIMVDGERKTIRLTRKLSERQADTAAAHLHALAAAKENGTEHEARTMTWLSGIGDGLHEKLAELGLVMPRVKAETITLGALVKRFRETIQVSPGTLAAYGQGLDSLTEHFGEDRDVSTLTALDGDEWRRAMVDEELALATVSKRVQSARLLFRRAVKWGMIPESPFAELKAGSQANPERQRFVDRATIVKVLAACPDSEWRLIVGLSRFAGLRCPSEHLALTWQDWSMEAGALTVRAPKTNSVRVVPVCPELAELLQAAYDDAEVGATSMIARYREANCNLRTKLYRILGQAGVEPWPRLFHSLRASRQSEWSAKHPLADVCKWMGNTPEVAARHYLMASGESFDAVVRGGMESRAGSPTERGRAKVARGVAQNRADWACVGMKSANPPEHPTERKSLDLQAQSSGLGSAHGEPVLMGMGAGGFEPP